MTEASNKIPPVPDSMPVLRGDLGAQSPEKLVSHPWSRWFLAIRSKINALNSALINLGIFIEGGGGGIPVAAGDTWSSIVITGTPGRVTVTNGSGIGGNPTINVIDFIRVISVLNALTIDNTGPENVVISVDPYFISRNQTAAQWVPVPRTATSPGVVGDISMDADYFYTCEGTNVWKRTARATW